MAEKKATIADLLGTLKKGSGQKGPGHTSFIKAFLLGLEKRGVDLGELNAHKTGTLIFQCMPEDMKKSLVEAAGSGEKAKWQIVRLVQNLKYRRSKYGEEWRNIEPLDIEKALKESGLVQ